MAYDPRFYSSEFRWDPETMETVDPEEPKTVGSSPDEQKFRYDSTKQRKIREINPQDRWNPKDDRRREEEVTIWNAPEEYPIPHFVHLGRRGRIGDIRIYGPDGRPINIGPTPQNHTPEWATINEAMAHFRKVQIAFDKLNRGELR